MEGLKLIAAYCGLVVLGEVVAYGAGRVFESVYPAASMPVFLGLFFLMFFVAWRIAVRVA
ncbi:MAG: hypothetical protein JOZ70_07425 [Pseudolabrys sp.]|nr:hypothetical protein [Pseudolabrys sp.]MBV9955065.1 hypothetical protein [Pseudolabrys sp.]